MSEQKQVAPQDKNLEAAVLNEGAAKGGATVDQAAVKQQAAAKTGTAPAPQAKAATPAATATKAPAAVKTPVTPAPQAAAKTDNAGEGNVPAGTQQSGLVVNADDFAAFQKWQADQATLKANTDMALQQAGNNKKFVPDPPPVTEEGKAQELDTEAQEQAKLEKEYGPGFVTAKGRDGVVRHFTRMTWDRLGGNKNQDGLKPIVVVPAEVRELQTAKQ